MSDQIQSALRTMKSNRGAVLYELSLESPVLIVFLRHFGCIFCQEAMRDISAQKSAIEEKGVRIVFVHMSENSVADGFFEEFNLAGVEHVSDPDCVFYTQFGLLKGSFNQLFGLKVWLRTAELAIKDLRRLKMQQIGDGFQMPGVFLVENGMVKERYIHKRASDRPNYAGLISCCEVSN
ncbi:MAG: peroxiredoxin-like family protein [Bacteroidota bacterium]